MQLTLPEAAKWKGCWSGTSAGMKGLEGSTDIQNPATFKKYNYHSSVSDTWFHISPDT